MEYYNGNKLLSLKDLNGKRPSIYICAGNRTAGKTFYFKRLMVRRWLSGKIRKFALFVRFEKEMVGATFSFWADVGPIAFPKHSMTQRAIMSGLFYEILIDGRPAGYIIALNDPQRVKTNSALFSDIDEWFFDEFMSETGKYCPDEKRKLDSVLMSIGRGGSKGSHTRYVRGYMCSNNVNLFNPYYIAWDICGRLQNRTKYMRGDGWVLEQTFNAEAARAVAETFSTADKDMIKYATKNEYLIDNNRFVEKLPGAKICIAILRNEKKEFGVWTTIDSSKVYVSPKYDPACSVVMSFSDADHFGGSYLLERSSPAVKNLRDCYNRGIVYFASGAARYAFITALAIK